MKREKNSLLFLKFSGKIAGIVTFVLLIFNANVMGQNYHYHAGTSTSSIATSQSDILRLNCDVRANNSYPLSVVTWDGANPSFYWKWTDGTSTYSNTVALPSNAIAPDVAILHNTDVDPRSFIVIIYTEEDAGNPGTCNYVHYQTWAYDHSTHTVSLFESEVDISCNTADGNFAAIDGDARGFFAMAWASNGDLHTIAGRLSLRAPSDPYINVGQEKTLNLPTTISGCDDIIWPDVAMYGKNTTSTNNYIYYSYLRCGNVNLCQQTQNWNDVHSGSSVPAVYSSHFETVSGNAVFTSPRIAANQYFALGGSGNDAEKNEFTLVAGLQDDIGGNPYSSIFAMTSTNDGSGNITYALYNTTTNTYLGYSPVIYDFFATSGGPYKTDENKQGFFINDWPVVAYDKTNEHVVIGWSMTYNEGVYNTYYPFGPFPAQVYANPYFDGTNDPSMQTPSGGRCAYNGIDDGAANANSNNVYYLAVSSHNTNDLVYAWVNGSGTIYSKVVTSGALPRLLFEDEGSFLAYPNPFKSNSGTIQLNIKSADEYVLKVYNLLGELKMKVKGRKTELQDKLTRTVNENESGLYLLSLENSSKQLIHEKISVIK